jgi:hypothetical protein
MTLYIDPIKMFIDFVYRDLSYLKLILKVVSFGCVALIFYNANTANRIENATHNTFGT